MSYTESMWLEYRELVLKMYGQGYMVYEIARALESSEELVKAVIEKYSVQNT